MREALRPSSRRGHRRVAGRDGRRRHRGRGRVPRPRRRDGGRGRRRPRARAGRAARPLLAEGRSLRARAARRGRARGRRARARVERTRARGRGHEGGQPHYPLLLSRSERVAIRVLLVEDNDVYRDSLEFLLGLQPGIEVVGAVAQRRRGRRRCARARAATSSSSTTGCPDVDGAAATRARIETSGAAVVFLSASARRRSTSASCAQARRARRARTRGSTRSSARSAPRGRRGLPREPDAREHGDRPRLDVRLPGRARPRFRTCAFVPLYVRFGDETYRDYVELAPRAVLREAAHGARRCRRPRSRRRRTSSPATRSSAAGYERIYSLHVSSKVSGTFRARELAAPELGGDRVRVVDTRDGVARDRDARARDPAPARRAGRRTRRSRRSSSASSARTTSSSPSRRSSTSQRGGRIGKAQALAGSLLNVQPILTVEDGVIVAGRPRPRAPEGTRRVRALLRRGRPRTGAGSASRSRTPTPRSGSAR